MSLVTSSSQCGELAQSCSQLVSDLTNQRAGKRHVTQQQTNKLWISLNGVWSLGTAHLLIEDHLSLQVKLHHSGIVIDTVAMEMIHLSLKGTGGVRLHTVLFYSCVCCVVCVCIVVQCVVYVCTVTLEWVAHAADAVIHALPVTVGDFSCRN